MSLEQLGLIADIVSALAIVITLVYLALQIRDSARSSRSATANSEGFLQGCVVLHDPTVMLTHYSKDVLFSEDARKQFVVPDLDPIPSSAATGVHGTVGREQA